jgi:hypothetical protein
MLGAPPDAYPPQGAFSDERVIPAGEDAFDCDNCRRDVTSDFTWRLEATRLLNFDENGLPRRYRSRY